MLKKIVLKFDTHAVIIRTIITVLFLTMAVTIGVLNNNYHKEKTQRITLMQMVDKSEINNSSLNHEINKLVKEVKEAKSASLVDFTAEDLRQDIKTMYPALSTKTKRIIVNNILKEAERYDINPLILYALLHTESSMRPWIEHSRILITINKKKKYIRAVGLGGVVWEWWGEQLKKEGIAEVRSDLFDPETNIKAVAYIYNAFYNKKKHKKATTQDESAMIRYFGGGYKSYFIKIDKQIAHLIRKKLYRPCTKKETNED